MLELYERKLIDAKCELNAWRQELEHSDTTRGEVQQQIAITQQMIVLYCQMTRFLGALAAA